MYLTEYLKKNTLKTDLENREEKRSTSDFLIMYSLHLKIYTAYVARVKTLYHRFKFKIKEGFEWVTQI